MVGVEDLRITGLCVSDTEPGVYNNWSLSEAPLPLRISDTQGLIFSTLCSYQHRISDTAHVP